MALIVEIQVIPSSGKSLVILDRSRKLKAYVKSPPEDGKANRELCKLVAQLLGCPQYLVSIAAGATSRKKKLYLDIPLSFEQILAKLGLAIQTKLPPL